MTTPTIHKAQAPAARLDALLKQQQSPLPAAIVHTEAVDGFRRPQWVARPLTDEARPVVERAKADLEARLQLGRREIIVGLLSRLAVQWPPKDTQAFGLVLSDMADDLAEFSEEQIAAACVEWRRTENWYPKIADLRTRLLTMRFFDEMHLRRARVLLGEEKPRSHELPPPHESAGNVFQIDQAMHAISAKLRVIG